MPHFINKPNNRKLKLVVQIPAYNEEKHIGLVIKEIPRKIPGISEVIVLVCDDGSTDNTIEAAKNAGADYIIKNTINHGLAYSFQRCINFALELGADIIVNTDADFQYNQKEIPKLIKPIIDKRADIVSGDRQVHKLNHMVSAKKYGNILGTKVVAGCAGYRIRDASSGFRAYSKQAAMKLFVTSKHTYTHQTLIQATHRNLEVCEVPVEFRKREGHSKLIKSVSGHIKKSMSTIMRTTLMFHSFKMLGYLGALLMLIGFIPLARWMVLSYIDGHFGQHTQSLLLGITLMIFGGLSLFLGFLSDLIALNRRYLEEILYKLNKMEFGNHLEEEKLILSPKTKKEKKVEKSDRKRV